MDPVNALAGYYMLNKIKPKYFENKFPYSADKALFTKNKIKILVKAYDKTKGAGEASRSIVFYE